MTRQKAVAKSNAMVTQKIAGKTYTLRASPTTHWSTTIAKTVGRVVLFPVMIPMMALASVVMATPLRNIILSAIIPRVMNKVEKEFENERQTLLSDLFGNVLDVGSGGGAYLKYCKKNSDRISSIVAIEPVEEMHPKIRESGGKTLKNKLTIVKDMSEVVGDITSDNSTSTAAKKFDWVILGNVLCEVPDVRATLKQVDSILKPGGKVYFSEHVARPKGTYKRLFQDLMNPLWTHIGGGCNCNRESNHLIKHTFSHWSMGMWTYEHIQVCMGPFVLGIAVKE